MIIRDKTRWFRLLFSVKGSGISATWRRIAMVTLAALAVTVSHELYGFPKTTLTTIPFTLIGVALGVFLGFNNNASYDRFWEGRKLWGQLVNVSRSLTRQVFTMVDLPSDRSAESGHSDASRQLAAFQREMVLRTIAYVHSLRHHLRDTEPWEDLAAFLPNDERTRLSEHRNVPAAQLHAMGQRLRWAWRQGWVHDYHLPTLDGSLTEMTSIQGGCERIRTTPIPFAYTVLIHRIVAFYCLFLPLGIVNDVQWMTPVVVLLISYAFFGLDELGDEIEEPFGTHPNDLPLSAICRNIEINLRQTLGDTDVPAPLQPVDSVLL